MTAPLDLMTGAQDALIKLLQDQLPATDRGIVRHSLAQDFSPPFHLVGDIDSDNVGRPGEQLEEIEAEVHSVYRGGDRRQLLTMLHKVRLACDNARIEIGGASFRVRWGGALASRAAGDGVTYAGATTLHITAEPA